jgi:hypothetical protein
MRSNNKLVSCPIGLAQLAPKQWDKQAAENKGLVTRVSAETSTQNQ